MARTAVRAIYKRQGRCPWCGKKLGQDGPQHCARCGAWNRAYQRRRYATLREAGRCVQCAKAEAVSPYVRCEACRTYMREYHRTYQRS
jgi:hypothetical protein